MSRLQVLLVLGLMQRSVLFRLFCKVCFMSIWLLLHFLLYHVCIPDLARTRPRPAFPLSSSTGILRRLSIPAGAFRSRRYVVQASHFSHIVNWINHAFGFNHSSIVSVFALPTVCQECIPQSEWAKFVSPELVDKYNQFNQPYRPFSRFCQDCDSELVACRHERSGGLCRER